jgi:hypothetical protein
LSLDGKATVSLGEYSRGGKTRGNAQACDPDMGCKEKHTPFGMLDEDAEPLPLVFGSSATTRDFLVNGLYAWWEHLPRERARSDVLPPDQG